MDVGKLVAYLGLNTQEFDSKLNQQSNVMKSWGKNLMAGIAGILSVRAIYQFLKESAKIQATYQEIYQGFQRLNDPLLLRDLQRATEGVLDKMTLMKEVTKARNFQIPMEVLATGLRFAKIRADETGQSIEELSDAVIMSLGRKSVRSLTQLGIATEDVRKELEKTGDFTTAVSNIMVRGIASVGTTVDTSAEKAERMSAAFRDWRLLIGEGINPLLDKMRVLLTKVFQGYTQDPNKDMVLNQLEHFKEFTLKGKDYETQIKLLSEAQAGFNEKSKDLNESINERRLLGFPEKDIEGIEAQVKIYSEAIGVFGQYIASLKAAQEAGTKQIGIINNIVTQIGLLKDTLGDLTSKADIKQTLIAIYDYEQELKDLTDLTPKIETLTKVQSKNALVVVDGLRQVDTSLKKNSAGWASYKENIWETIQQTESFAEIAVPLITNAVESIAQSIAGLISQTDSIEGFFRNIALMVAEVAIQIGKIIAAMGAALLISKATRKEGFKLIAEGGALITAGYIAKGYVNRGSSSYSSVSPGNSSYGSPNSLSATRISVAVTGELDGRKLSIVGVRGTKMLSQVT